MIKASGERDGRRHWNGLQGVRKRVSRWWVLQVVLRVVVLRVVLLRVVLLRVVLRRRDVAAVLCGHALPPPAAWCFAPHILVVGGGWSVGVGGRHHLSRGTLGATQ